MVEVKNAVPGTWYCTEDQGKWYLLRYGFDMVWFYNGCSHRGSPRAAIRNGRVYGLQRDPMGYTSEAELREVVGTSLHIETLQLPKGR